MDTISYCRVSTEEQAQEGGSLAAQEARVRVYCTTAGLTLLATIRDEGVSAAKPLASRPGGAALLRAIARTGGSSAKRVKSEHCFHKSLIYFVKNFS